MNFDEEAKDWDNDIKKVERSQIIAAEIMDFIQPKSDSNALEFGCGTGLLSFQLQDFFKTITLVDSSAGMIKVLKEKIAHSNIKNFNPIHIQSVDDEMFKGKFDAIYTLMALHHIVDINKIALIFNHILKSGAYLFIADLVTEDGSFHSHVIDFDGHNGFDKNDLSKILSSNGFEMVDYKICLEIEKLIGQNMKKYPLFLMVCRKK